MQGIRYEFVNITYFIYTFPKMAQLIRKISMSFCQVLQKGIYRQGFSVTPVLVKRRRKIGIGDVFRKFTGERIQVQKILFSKLYEQYSGN